MQTVQYTSSQLLSCAPCEGEVYLCVDALLVAANMPFINASVASVTNSWSSCGTAQYIYGFTYDENELADPNTPLTASDIEGITCKGCLTDIITAIGTPSLAYIMSLVDSFFDNFCLVNTEAELIAAIANVDCNEIIVGTSFSLTANRVIPIGKDLVILNGAEIVINGHTFTINGSFSSGIYQTFDISIGIGSSVVFGNNSIEYVYPQWFGALGDDTTDDTAAIQAAIDSIEVSGGWVFFPSGYYRNIGISLPRSVSIRGTGPKNCNLRYTPVTGNGIELITAGPLSNWYNIILDIKIESINTSTGHAVKSQDATNVTDFYINNYEIEGFLIGIYFPVGLHIKIGMGRLLGQGQGVVGGIAVRLGTSSGVRINIAEIENAYANGYEKSFYSAVSIANYDHVTSEAAETAIYHAAGRLFIHGSWIQGSTYLFEIPSAGHTITAMHNYLLDGASAEVDDVTSMSNLADPNNLSVFFQSDWKGTGVFRYRLATTQARALQFGATDPAYIYHNASRLRVESEVTAPLEVNRNNVGASNASLLRAVRNGVTLGGIACDADSQLYLATSAFAGPAVLWNDARDVAVGGGTVGTTATAGFLYVPKCAGPPTGVPAPVGQFSTFAPIVIDSTNNKLYFYSGGSWRDAGP